jgi:hypothetical protein
VVWVVIVVLNSFPPSRSLYFTVLPPPETTPRLTVRLEAGTPRFVAARLSSTLFAVAAAARIAVERLEMPPEPLPPPTA